jgi:hypothetical protein
MIVLLIVGVVVLVGTGSWGYTYGGWHGYWPGGLLGVLGLVLVGVELLLLWGD